MSIALKTIPKLDGETALEESIKQNDERILKEKIALAALLAEATVSKEDTAHYCTSIRGEYEALAGHARKFYQGDLHRFIGRSERTAADMEINSNKEAIPKYKEDVRIVKLDREGKKVKPHHWNLAKWFPVTEGIILISDAVYNITSFTVMGGTILCAIPGALTFGVALFFAVFGIPAHLKRISHPGKRMTFGLFYGALVLALMTAVSLLRAASTVGHGTITSLSNPVVLGAALIFTILQSCIVLFLILGASLLPENDEQAAYAEWSALDENHKKLTQTIKALESRNREVSVQVMKSLQERGTIIEKERVCCEHIDTLRERTIQSFIGELKLRTRRDQSVLF